LALRVYRVLCRQQVDVAIGAERHIATCTDVAAAHGEGGFWRAGGANVDVATRTDRGCCGGIACDRGFVRALAATDRNGKIDATARVWIGLYGVVGIDCRQCGGCARQRVHARVAGLASRACHLLTGLDGGNDGVADCHGQAGLTEYIFLGVVAGFARFDDIDGLGVDIDVALRDDDMAAGLLVSITCHQANIALGGADG